MSRSVPALRSARQFVYWHGARFARAGACGAAPSGPMLPDEFGAEFTLLLGKGLTPVQIRDFLPGEFTPLPLADVMAVLKAREAPGAIKLVRRMVGGR